MKKILLLHLIGILFVLMSCTDQEKTRCDVAIEVELKEYSNYLVDIGSGFPPTFKTTILTSIPKNPDAVLSSLQDIEIQAILTRWTRADGGTIAPKDFRQTWTVIVPADGTATLNNANYMGTEQLLQMPFAQLLPENGGRDLETGNSTIICDMEVVFYGRTINGCDIESQHATATFEFYYGGGR